MNAPSRIFQTPDAVVKDRRISDEEKVEILEQWRNEVQQRTVATEEGMTESDGSEAILLQRLTDALWALRDDRAPHD